MQLDPRRWSLARQAFAMLVLAVVVVVTAAVGAAYLQTRDTVTDAKRAEVLAVAESIAVSPTVAAAVREAGDDGEPTRTLQPYAEQIRLATRTDFITVMSPQGIRYTHPNPALIGQRFLGHTEAALAGRALTETYTGTLGPSVRAVVPVFAGGSQGPGDVVALVAVGVTVDNVGVEVRRQLPALLLAGLVTLLAGALGAALLSRRLRRQTHGLGPGELSRMYEFYDGVLHAVREGLLLLDTERRLQLINDEGKRLLGLDDDAIGRELATLPLPPALAEALAQPGRRVDELQLTADRVLVVSQSPAQWNGRILGSVVTLRDHTDLVALSDQLSSARGLADSLRSQAHESANRLHSVITMIELGQTDRALEFATAELAEVQELTDRVVQAVQEPVIAALLLGKAAEAAERGVQLTFPGDLQLDDGALPARDLLTIIGNLIDNALDATLDGAGAERRVAVTSTQTPWQLHISVSNSGPPVPDPERIFERGWSTKSGEHGGLGLALVRQAVTRLHGTIEVTGDPDTRFDVRLPIEARVGEPG